MFRNPINLPALGDAIGVFGVPPQPWEHLLEISFVGSRQAENEQKIIMLILAGEKC